MLLPPRLYALLIFTISRSISALAILTAFYMTFTAIATTTPSLCDTDEFYCASDDRCFPLSSMCDGFPDCFAAEDEMDCGKLKLMNLLPAWHHTTTSMPISTYGRTYVCSQPT